MISSEMIAKIQDKIHSTMKEMLGSEYNNDTKVSFRKDMKSVAGYAYQYQNRIELNEQLFESNQETFFSRTIPHECAHLIQKRLYPQAKQAHGPEFRSILRCLGADTSTRHQMDVSVAYGKPMYQYKCSCDRVLNLTKLIHTRVQSGSSRHCKACKTIISFIGMSK